MDGSNEVRDEKPSIAVSQAIAAEVKNGYTMNVHNGDLAYADGFLADWDNYYGQLHSCLYSLGGQAFIHRKSVRLHAGWSASPAKTEMFRSKACHGFKKLQGIVAFLLCP